MSAPPVAVRSRMFREMGSLLWQAVGIDIALTVIIYAHVYSEPPLAVHASCRYDCSCSQFSLLGHGHLPSSSLKTTISSMKSSQGHGAVVVFSSGSVFWVHISVILVIQKFSMICSVSPNDDRHSKAKMGRHHRTYLIEAASVCRQTTPRVVCMGNAAFLANVAGIGSR